MLKAASILSRAVQCSSGWLYADNVFFSLMLLHSYLMGLIIIWT